MEKMDAWERRTVVYRRLFHKYPEPGWLTFFATIFIAEHLEKAGFKVLVGREILKDEKRMDPPTEEETALWEQRAVKLAIEQGIAKDKVATWIIVPELWQFWIQSGKERRRLFGLIWMR